MHCFRRIGYFILLLLPVSTFGQERALNVHEYPTDYFRNPLAIPIYLAGNFGECRPGHFHSGVDIKTNGKENEPVHAAADGYISRIKMEKGGFGHALYITHPNGYTTLYAHLNNFVPAIQKYLTQQQYAQQRWDVDLQLSSSQIPVKKGEQIAWSGNTGASTAPHLHFEIRNTKTEHPLNPELFGLPIKDTRAPLPAAIAIYNAGKSIYEQEAKIISVKANNGVYRPVTDTLTIAASSIGIGIDVDDYMDGSDNTIAFYTADLYLDGTPQATVRLDDIGYDETRYINGYTDYKTRENKKKWIQLLYKLPGNHLDHIYEDLNTEHGALIIKDAAPHKVEVRITDDKGNIARIAFYLKSKGSEENLLCEHLFKSSEANNFETPNVMFSLDDRSLYDDVCFKYSSTSDNEHYSARHYIHYPYVPVHHYFTLSIKPDKAIPFNMRDKVAMIYSDGKEESGSAAISGDKGWYHTQVRAFGTYYLAADTVPPLIKPMQKNGAVLAVAKEIVFEVKDAMTSVKKFSGKLDGKWICFEQHGSRFFYKFDVHCAKGKHTLVFTAADENNNEQTIKQTFTK
ncbi:MAG: M23 family metallopeptidase [Taibaiella sp.]|nr:M23 family metallopeptidase [Taibaiella sp.]